MKFISYHYQGRGFSRSGHSCNHHGLFGGFYCREDSLLLWSRRVGGHFFSNSAIIPSALHNSIFVCACRAHSLVSCACAIRINSALAAEICKSPSKILMRTYCSLLVIVSTDVDFMLADLSSCTGPRSASLHLAQSA